MYNNPERKKDSGMSKTLYKHFSRFFLRFFLVRSNGDDGFDNMAY